MSSIIIDDQTLKELLKEALIEVLQKRPDVLRDVLAEAMEDIGLAQAIREGRNTAAVGKDAVLKALEQPASPPQADGSTKRAWHGVRVDSKMYL